MYPPTSSSATPSSISESESEIPVSSKFLISKTTLEKETQHPLLAPKAVPAIVSLFDLGSANDTGSLRLHRAIEHSQLRVASGRDDL